MLGHGKKVTEQMHLLSEDIGARNSSGDKEKATKQRALTDWGPHREEINQVIERQRPCQEYSRPGDHRERNKSEYGKKATRPGSLTNWRPKREEQVRTRKETDQVRSTHRLETTEGATSQNLGRKRPCKRPSQSGDRRHRKKSRD